MLEGITRRTKRSSWRRRSSLFNHQSGRRGGKESIQHSNVTEESFPSSINTTEELDNERPKMSTKRGRSQKKEKRERERLFFSLQKRDRRDYRALEDEGIALLFQRCSSLERRSLSDERSDSFEGRSNFH